MKNYTILNNILPDLIKDTGLSYSIIHGLAICEILKSLQKENGKYFRLQWAVEVGLLGSPSIKPYTAALLSSGMLAKTYIYGRKYYYLTIKADKTISDIKAKMLYKKQKITKYRLSCQIPINILRELKSRGLL
jgi:hypothetical protein